MGERPRAWKGDNVQRFRSSGWAENPVRFRMWCRDVTLQLTMTTMERMRPPSESSHHILAYEPTCMCPCSIYFLRLSQGGGRQTDREDDGARVENYVCNGVVGSRGGGRGLACVVGEMCKRCEGEGGRERTYKARTLEFLMSRHQTQTTPFIRTVLSMTSKAGRPLGSAPLV